ncbi:MAG: hypothetical protein JXR36_04190 [Bacteroidales bacterium]|nr:hypothetical protein [Bacteroidales bacterium]
MKTDVVYMGIIFTVDYDSYVTNDTPDNRLIADDFIELNKVCVYGTDIDIMDIINPADLEQILREVFDIEIESPQKAFNHEEF